MPKFTITREIRAPHGRYVATLAGAPGEAELTFTQRGPALVLADHAYAPPEMRGSGMALALVERLVADARAEGFKVTPLCPYVRLQFQRHPEWADVLQPQN